MRATLSIVIPTLNAQAGLCRALPALTEGLQAGLIRELVISDGESRDETPRIAEAAGAVLVDGPPSRGGQLRRGAHAAHGEWLLFLHADCVLPDGWADAVLTHVANGGPAAFGLRFDEAGFAPALVAGWANWRSRVFGLPYGDQALLVSRAQYDAAGGYPDIPLMEDVALVRALRRTTGHRIKILPLCVQTDSAKYQRDGWVRRGMGNLVRLARYLLGADPAHLARGY